MRYLYALALSFFAITSASAQKENNNWYFGSRAGVTFNTTPPTALSDGAMNTTEGCATRSDANGNLLFYTNGVGVYNRFHTLMPNGTGLLGGGSSTNSALIVPVQDNTDQYYIFTVQQLNDPQPTTFCYSIVDMTLDTGRGDILVKNQVLHSGVTERLAAVKHANKRDTWVMVNGHGDSSLYAFLITPFGVTAQPVVSTVGEPLKGVYGVGQMKFSSDGTKLAYAVCIKNYVALCDFDANTGVASNYRKLPVGWVLNPASIYGGTYGLEFSPSSQLLYVATDDSMAIFQWDITSGDETITNSTLQKVAQLVGRPYALQHAPDHKIYICVQSKYYLGVINAPNVSGTGCNVVENAIDLGIRRGFSGLPSAIASDLFTVNVPEELTFSNAGMYPNPAHDFITINGDKASIVSIFDASGRMVMHHALSSAVSTIDISSIAKGVYTVRIEDESKASQSVKLVVQ